MTRRGDAIEGEEAYEPWNDPDHHTAADVGRRFADVAAQPQLGICP